MGFVTLDDISFGDATVDAAFQQWREAIERANSWSVHGHAQLEPGTGGYALFVRPASAKVARTGGTAIPAMSGSTPGEGTVTLYALGDTLVAEGTVKAKNIAPATVTANTWIVVVLTDGKWLIIYEICPAV